MTTAADIYQAMIAGASRDRVDALVCDAMAGCSAAVAQFDAQIERLQAQKAAAEADRDGWVKFYGEVLGTPEAS